MGSKKNTTKNNIGNVNVTGWMGMALVILTLIFQGCAGNKKVGLEKEDKSGLKNKHSEAVVVDEGRDLSGLRNAVKTPEDANVLDLMLGYRMLLVQNPDATGLDKDILKKSRQAFEKLEESLRHGGIKSQTQSEGERVYTIKNSDKVSMQEVIQSASHAAEKNAQAGEWENARARWKEIVQSKAAVSFAIDEAQWGLVLVDALHSSLPDSIKKSLKDVNESYIADINQEEIAKQVKKLLQNISDVKMQRELKKLANRAWEKDWQAGKIRSPNATQTQPPELMDKEISEKNSETKPNLTTPETEKTDSTKTNSDVVALVAEVDTLNSQGKYVAALKVLEKAGDQLWVKAKKEQIGDRFCEDKRRSAANSFKDFKNANTEVLKLNHLKRTASDLDSCLFYFPEITVSQKVRKNREMVEVELKKLKP